MDRRHRSMLVQFWLTVESFKNPLESVDSESSDEDEDGGATQQDSSSSKTLKDDISLINDLYFSATTPHPALAAISPRHVEAIRAFASDTTPPSAAVERRVRRAVMFAQRQAEQDMEQDFDEFKRSELWHRVVGDVEPQAWRAPSNSTLTPVSAAKSPKGSRRPLPSSLSPELETPSLISNLFGSSPSLPAPINLSPATPSSSGYLTRPTPSNLELLMTPGGPADTRTPLFNDPDDSRVLAPDEAQLHRMEAIQAALTDIIALDQEHGAELSDIAPSNNRQTSTNSDIIHHSHRPGNETAKRRLLFDEDVDSTEERTTDPEEGELGNFQMAGPGDLQLAHEIARLSEKIIKLEGQDAILDTLVKKAELTGDTQELRLLRQSRASFDRELRELRFQKTQYEQQEAANKLISDRAKISIVSSAVAEENGKNVVRYLIEVQQLAIDGGFASGWVVARRYNEFLAMHQKLREKYALVRNLDFPGKRLVTALSGNFVDTRRAALEKYMQVCGYSLNVTEKTLNSVQGLIAIPAACESEELRTFLSRDSPFMAAEPQVVTSKGQIGFPGQGLVRNVYKSVTESIDDMFFGPSMLDVMIQRLTRQAAEFVGIVGSGVNDEDLVAQALRASGPKASEATLARLSGDLKPLEGETSTSTFSSPICDLLLALFELDEKKNWLRRQAIVIILQQVFGETIERCVQ
jgi:sorting nexin-25